VKFPAAFKHYLLVEHDFFERRLTMHRQRNVYAAVLIFVLSALPGASQSPPASSSSVLEQAAELGLEAPAGAAGQLAPGLAEGMIGPSRSRSCKQTCFTHSCSIECPSGMEADCDCSQVNLPNGFKQWMVSCRCKRATAASLSTEVLEGEQGMTSTDDVEWPDGTGERAVLLKRNGWFELYKESTPRAHKVKCVGGSAGAGERVGIEVEVDGELKYTLLKGEEKSFSGKLIRLRATSLTARYTASDRSQAEAEPGAESPAAETPAPVVSSDEVEDLKEGEALDLPLLEEGAGGVCEMNCFKHSCEKPCDQGKYPSCRCEPRRLPDGRIQWLPRCDCRKR
jgi:hypothetical protein